MTELRQITDLCPNTTLGALVVTGASGYIGREVVRMALLAGFQVRALSRRPMASPCAPTDPAFHTFAFTLGEDVPEAALVGALAVIHLALDTTAGDANLQGTLHLRAAAHRQGVRRFVFVSSQSATPDALSAYGRNKWAIEQKLKEPEDVVVRPGMVYGGEEQGLYGVLCRLVALPVIPLIRPDAPLYPIPVESLARALIGLATAPSVPDRVVCLGSAEMVSLQIFLELLGKARCGRKPWILPVPAWPLLAVLTPLSRISARMAFLRERLLGIQGLSAMDTATGNHLASISLPSLGSSPEIKGGSAVRRALLREGSALMRYVFSGHVSRFAVRRWVRLLPGHVQPMALPPPLITHPLLLRLIEPLPLLSRNSEALEFAKRLHLALLVGEVSGRSAERVTARRGGRMTAALDLVVTGLQEAGVMLPRLLVHLAWWRR